jgi:inositol oxygenase
VANLRNLEFRNAHPQKRRLTPILREELALRVIRDLIPVSTAAAEFNVSSKTAAKWVRRSRQDGHQGLLDRTSRPHRSPRELSPERSDEECKGVLVSILHRPPSDFGINRSSWRIVDLRRVIQEEEMPLSGARIQRVLRIRADGHPRWFVLAGFVHDLGKVLCLWGEPQWGVVGDTFPVGCGFSEDIVFPEYFAVNPDRLHPVYSTEYGVYEPNCGLEQVHMSFGHDGYIYEVMKRYLPQEALYMLRYHSFYSAHKHGAYRHLMNDQDVAMFCWVNEFNKYDLYSKGHAKPRLEQIKSYYDELFAEFFPSAIAW